MSDRPLKITSAGGVLIAKRKESLVAMHNVYLAITFAGVVALVFASLVALERVIG